MGSRVKMFGEKETVKSVRDTSKKHFETSRGVFVQYVVAVEAEICHGIGS